MMFGSFISDMTVAPSGAGATYPSEAPEFTICKDIWQQYNTVCSKDTYVM